MPCLLHGQFGGLLPTKTVLRLRIETTELLGALL
jgi:hypothetical protein